jgi:ERCC4-type nuclease
MEPAAMVADLKTLARRADTDILAHPRCEDSGADFLWRHHKQWYGVQRKQLDDFLSSLRDGRLTKEVAQMKAAIVMPVVVVEGKVRFINGVLASSNGWGARDITEDGWQGRLLTLMHMGVHVQYTRDRTDTARWVVAYYRWSARTEHGTASTRPGPSRDYWGTVSNKDFQVHVLSSLPGVGPRLANRIVDHLGQFPLQMTVTLEELMTVPGLGRVKAQKILRTFGQGMDKE